ncbi:MAG: hypothetical protein V3V93_06770 [bacterium]
MASDSATPKGACSACCDAYDLTRFVASIRQSLTPGCLPGPTVQREEEKGPK